MSGGPVVTVQLQDLFDAIAHTKDENALAQAIATQAGDYFAASRCKLFYVRDLLKFQETASTPMRKALSLDSNPVLRYLMRRHAAVHDEVVLPPGLWKTICPRADHAHVMAGPVIYSGQLIGGLAFTRHRHDEAFNADDLADLSALCMHLSSQLATLRLQRTRHSVPSQHLLTSREYEIAELVAKGLTNRKIGEALWITENSVKQALKRMYRKLKVSSRAEMVAQLSQTLS